METNDQIESIERLLLPATCRFEEDARRVINCWESTDVLACPGSGKTTVLMAKLKMLANRMPLDGGCGVCILSHTNVAINEIKTRLKEDAEKILGYPNFAGTIQSFVDAFVVFPIWRSQSNGPLRIISEDEFARRVWMRIQRDRQKSVLKTLIERRFGNNKRYNTAIQVIKQLSLRNGDLLLDGNTVAGSSSKSAQLYTSLNCSLHREEGLMTYEQALEWTRDIFQRYGNYIRPLISKRFKYVFIDEYQDCSEVQRSVLREMFLGTDTVVQRIGDLDQAIYNTISETRDEPWIVAERHLELSRTNRYGNEIAKVLTKLRSGQITIVSARGSMNRKPILLVYSNGMEKKVIEAFVREIRKAGLPIDGTYKAIGMIRRGAGITITDYWSSLEAAVSPTTEGGWEFYQQELVNQLRKRQLYGVAKTIVEILVFVLRCCNVRTDNDRFYTKTQVRRKINEKDNNAFHLGIMNLAVEFAKDPQKIKRALLVFLCQLCKLVFDHQWDVDQLATMISYDAEERESCPTALDQYYDDGIKVQLNTVHGVKGETHNATLYLETEHRRGSDLKRIMPLFEDKCFRNEGVYESSRRCAYVGMSRPRDLLCVAMRETTYEGHEPAFEDDWNVIHLQ